MGRRLLEAWHLRGSESNWISAFGDPLSAKVNSAALLTVVGDRPPVFKATFHAHGSELDVAAANFAVLSHVFIHHAQLHIISDALHLKFNSLIPAGSLASIFKGTRT